MTNFTNFLTVMLIILWTVEIADVSFNLYNTISLPLQIFMILQALVGFGHVLCLEHVRFTLFSCFSACLFVVFFLRKAGPFV